MGGFKTKFRIIKTSHNARKELRDALRPHENSLLTEINLLLDRARLLLKQKTQYSDFVLILDNLEKIRKVSGKDESSSLEFLFVGSAYQLGGMAAHTVLTLPLSLVRSHIGGEWKQLYGCEPFVLPMVKVHPRNETSHYEPGWTALKALLQKRLDLMPNSPKLSWNEVFNENATNLLIEASGGDVRTLMYFIQEAITEEDQAPVTHKSAFTAIGGTARTFASSVRHWDKLVQLAEMTDPRIPNNDPDYLELLRQGAILEYINGSNEEEGEAVGLEGLLLDEVTPWYAVHPIVKQLPQFKTARQNREKPLELPE